MSGAAVGLALGSRPARADDTAYGSVDELRARVREAVSESGVPSLATYIARGARVLMKPNWVLHRNAGNHGETSLVTHPRFILAALHEVLAAGPSQVTIGDAPVQGCDFDRVVTPELRTEVARLAAAHDVPIEIVDFRRVYTPGGNLAGEVESERRPLDRYALFDLGRDSLLEPISEPGRFRITQYDPDKLARVHCPGRHQFLLCRDAFEADVIVNLPKLKLHKKAGITGALKNLVGLNGDKDYLPHHRVGGAAAGGDCYPGASVPRRLAELMLDTANRRIGHRRYLVWRTLAQLCWLATPNRDDGAQLDASWWGNDTCWRMALDLNRIVCYGRPDGTMADRPQRTMLTLTDAIVCGEGDGPLAPEPLAVGAVTFSDCAAAAEVAHAALLRVDDRTLPIITQAFGSFRWPLASGAPRLFRRGEAITPRALSAEAGVTSRPPRGWQGHIELGARAVDAR